MIWWWLVLGAFAGEPLGPFPDCGEDGGCPNDLTAWEHLGWIPANSRGSVRDEELSLGAGAAMDVALRTTTGRHDVAVAVLDSGIEWQQVDLAGEVLLNTAELPLPQDAQGTPAATHDLDGNGVVNVFDWADDPRVDIAAGVDAADDRLDPSDLIHTFSDGVDDDENGFVDDIAGWDFYGDDNDPYAELDARDSGHGTGVARRAVEGADDGGKMGTCPGCSLLPVRIGDTFITDGDRVARGVRYASLRGARAVAMAVGALSHPRAAREAILEADANGVVIVAAAGDENSYHHNFPAFEDRVLYVHSVRGNNLDESGGGVYSFMAFWNCNNYGPRVDLSAASPLCATGAVAVTAGAAGLVASAGRDAGLELSSAEIRALLKHTADDIDFDAEDQAELDTWPARPGWDAYYGHGRLNAGEAVRRVVDGEIPPEVGIDGPSWFAWPETPVAVTGRVAAPRAGGVSWTVEVGRGADPEGWTLVAEGDGPKDGVLATVEPDFPAVSFGDLDAETAGDRMVRAHEALVQVRVTATDDAGREATARRGFWVHDDPDRLPGFPVDLVSSAEGAPVLADLDGDAVLEIVVAGSGGTLHVLDGSGTPVEGFPVSTDLLEADQHEGVVAAPAVGDLDGDGDPEIVVASLQGRVYAWHADGAPVEGFPVAIVGRAPEEFGGPRGWDNGIAAAPSLGDADGDGDLEIVVAAMDQRLYLWDGDGSLLPGWPLELCETCGIEGFRLLSSPALGDLDGDGDLDAVLGSNETPRGATGLSWAVDLSTATVLEGWPQARDGLLDQIVLPLFGEGHPAAVGLADIDGDGDLELASNPVLGTGDLLHHDGTVAADLLWTADGYGDDSNVDDGSFMGLATHPAFGDLDGDGVPDLFTGGIGVMYLVSLPVTKARDFQHALGGWSGATGEALPGFPRQVDDVSFLNAPAVGDLTGDGRPEAVYGSGGFFLYAWDADGTIAPGWPKLLGGWQMGGPALGDVDGDGWTDVVATTREGYLFAWTTGGRADQAPEWASTFHDAANTGNYATPLPAQPGPPDELAPGGCCAGDGSSGSEALLLLPLLGWLRRRRPGEAALR